MKSLMLGGEALIIGRNSIEYLKNIYDKKVFIVTGGKSMLNNGTIGRINDILTANSCDTYIHSGIKANPDTDDVEQGLKLVNSFNPDILLAVGGRISAGRRKNSGPSI